MCDKCFAVLKNLVKPHMAAMCPLSKGYYCGACACYGHTATRCPDTMTQMFRVPQYMEQLISPTLLEEYKIHSRTPLYFVPEVKPLIPPMVVPETSEALRAALISMDIKPKICQAQNVAEEMRINKLRVEESAMALEREVEFIDPNAVLPPFAAPITKRKYKLRKKADSTVDGSNALQEKDTAGAS